MSLYTRPNGSNRFATDPRLAPDIGVAIDAEINNIVGIINDLDNANISGSPQIDSSKIDLSVGGFLQDIGDDITGTLNHIFDGVWRRMRASGNARMREYYGSDGALWGIVYNSEWGGTSWNGRDVTGICMAIKIEADGIHFYYAVSAAAGVAPTWTEIFHCNLSGNPLASASADGEITTIKVNNGAITGAKISKIIVSSGSQGIISGATWTPAAGIYNIVEDSVQGDDVYLQLYISATWRGKSVGTGLHPQGMGAHIFDGTNMRFNNGGTYSCTLYYQTF